MMNVNTRNELMDEAVLNVAGGNYGDADTDNGETPRYSIGDTVEVFRTTFHITTRTDRIVAVRKYKGNFLMGSRWLYITENGETVSADHIER